MAQEKSNKYYATHWNSFWFGFMSALTVTFFLLFIGTVFEQISFNIHPAKKVTIKTQEQKPEKDTTTNQTLTDFLKKNNIDEEKINSCVSQKTYAQKVKDDAKSGKEAGVKGTPHSFVLIGDAVYEIPGAQSEEGMREFFDDLLSGKKPRAKDISKTVKLKPVDDNDWIAGSDDAKITVIEYSDLECPFCKKFHKATTNMMQDYAKDVRWVFRHTPIDNLHPKAREKAETAECIGNIAGAPMFWKYLDNVFSQK